MIRRSSRSSGRGASAHPAPSIHVLTVTLLEVTPPIWRRLEVPSDVTLARLHRILQAAMGWQNAHLHEFVAGDDRFGDPDPDFPGPESDRRIRLAEVVAEPGARLAYLYDFGDGWEHGLVVDAVRPPAPGAAYPVCIAGERACPPEDCGGPPGYFELLEALGNPTHEEHDHMIGWVGGAFDPEAFNLSAVNADLRRVR